MSLSQIFRDFDDGREESSVTTSVGGGLREGESISNYTLLNPLGEGGFGAVWLARQERPIRREVALKILKLGMDTEEILGRFDQERQAMAMMDHPNIAMVFDAGATSSGRPFVAMELIAEGEAITDFCDQKKLETKDRINLFLPACGAIQHAHRKGILHRDIKPSNILVSGDGTQKVKVIDFGIAKAIGTDDLTAMPIKTQLDRLIGTPAYMSPEQLSRSGDIDTRSDVYSLGVVLYELLTGTLPFSNTELVREVPPPKPSTQISSTESQVARQLESSLKGDLDCIILKALDPDPNRRYDTPSQLAQDLKRHLAHEPIRARPESGLYIARRFAQRNKAAVLGVVGVFVALSVGLTFSTLAFLREKEARRAEAVQSARNQQITSFLTEILASAGVSKALGRDATMLREILSEASQKIESSPNLAAEVEWELRNIIGETFMDLDEYPAAFSQFEISFKLIDGLSRGDEKDRAKVLLNLANAEERRGNIKKAEQLVEQLLKKLQANPDFHPHRILEAKNLLSWIYLKSGRSAEGEAFAKECYEAWLEHPEDISLRDAPVTYATILGHLGRKKEAEQISREELSALRDLHPEYHPDIATCLGNLGRVVLSNGKIDEAYEILTEALNHGRFLYGDRSPHEDQILTNLSKIEGRRQNYAREQELAKEAVLAAKRTFEAGHRYRKQSSRFYEKVLHKQAERAFAKGDVAWLQRCETLLDELVKLSPEIKVNRELPGELKSKLVEKGPNH
ncbi:MAG: serine/threonine-protein kinase [Verrucomicrobiota bacterium]